MSRPAIVVACATAGSLLLGGPVAVAAGPAVEVTSVHVDASLRSAELTVVATGLPPDAGLDPSAVTVSVGGRQLPTTATVADQVESVTVPRVMLVVDTSGSMLGQPLVEAKDAITTFAAATDPAVEIGLVTFSTTPSLVLAPTTDRSRLMGAVTAMQAQGETALYDAATTAAEALGGSGDRRLVLLSDGGDTRSRTPLERALSRLANTGVTVDAIGFRTDETVAGVLDQLASAGHGRVHPVQTAAELSAALVSTSRPHARALALHVLLPGDVRGEQTLEISIGSSAGPLPTRQDIVLGAEPTVVLTEDAWWGTRDAMLAGTAAIGGALLLGSLLLAGRGRDRRRVHAVLQQYTTAAPQAKESLRTASPVTRTALDLAERVSTSRGAQDRLKNRLDRAAVALAPAEWLLMCAGIGVGTTLLLILLSWHLLLALAVGALAAWLLPRNYLNVRGGRRLKAFEERLPDALQMVAGSLSAGYSLAQALDGVVRDGAEPLAGEFGRALAESRLGVPVETTLRAVAERMDSRDFGWVVMAIRVQREVGGNLAGILTTVSATMRERAMLRRHVKALSAEGRLSAYILLGLPIALTGYMLLVRREYLEPLYTTPLGLAMAGGGVLFMVVGSFVMSRLVNVEV